MNEHSRQFGLELEFVADSRSFEPPALGVDMDAVGGYLLLGRISENRPATVWKGRDPARERDVALTRVELSTDDVIVRLRAQARLLIGISHRSIVELVELVEEQQHAWMVEAWLDAAPLSAVLTDSGPFSAEQAVTIVDNVLAGLGHAHDRAIVHGNLSPETVLLDVTGAAKVRDFGSCVIIDSVAPGAALSPEARSGDPITPRSDVHSMGTLLASLLPAPTPPELAHVVRTAIADDPADRYGDAEEFSSALTVAAAQAFGPDWSNTAGIGARVQAALAKLDVPSAAPGGSVEFAGPLTGRGADYSANRTATRSVNRVVAVAGQAATVPAVQVRSADRPARSAVDDEADVRKYLESRSIRGARADRNASRFIPLAAMVVVVAAIAVLVLTYHGPKPKTTAASDFSGRYAAQITVLNASDGTTSAVPAGSVLNENWQVRPTCASTTECTATVNAGAAGSFTLTYAYGSWTGGRSVTSAGSCASTTFVLSPSVGDGDARELTGSVLSRSGDCAAPQQQQTGSLVLTRIED